MILKAVLDTNILISGMMWRGIPYELLGWAEKDVLSIYTSLDILKEVYRVFHYPKFQKFIDRENTSPAELFAKIESLCTVIEIDQNADQRCSDPDDDKFLSCAVSGKVPYLISGDKHLLDMKTCMNIRIMSAHEFYSLVENVRHPGIAPDFV